METSPEEKTQHQLSERLEENQGRMAFKIEAKRRECLGRVVSSAKRSVRYLLKRHPLDQTIGAPGRSEQRHSQETSGRSQSGWLVVNGKSNVEVAIWTSDMVCQTAVVKV